MVAKLIYLWLLLVILFNFIYFVQLKPLICLTDSIFINKCAYMYAI